MSRPKYDHVDKEDRLAQLSSRTETISKSFVTDLWMKVLHRAIDDIVLFTTMRDGNIPLKEEEIELEKSANEFLFDDSHRIPMDDYIVNIKCSCCEDTIYTDNMSVLSAGDSICPTCSFKADEKLTKYEISSEFLVKDVSLAELLAMWNIYDVSGFRKGTRIRIEKLVIKKKNAAIARAKAKENKMKNGLRAIKKEPKESENFQPPTKTELSDFDKGIIKVLDETKEMLMAKNRKYGNSATKPVRAFSKADPQEQIKVRIDDKISRLIRSNSKEEDEDVVKDLIGYLTILAAIQRGYVQ